MDGSAALLLLALPLLAILVIGVLGKILEAVHRRRLKREESELLRIPLTDTRSAPAGSRPGGGVLVTGSAVVTADLLRRAIGSLRKLVGGELRGYGRLMDLARREAICRMMREARGHRAVAVVNVRLETSNIGVRKRKSREPAPVVEVIASATALLPRGAPPSALDVTLACPECGYALIGIDELGCPECGWNRKGR